MREGSKKGREGYGPDVESRETGCERARETEDGVLRLCTDASARHDVKEKRRSKRTALYKTTPGAATKLPVKRGSRKNSDSAKKNGG